MKTRTCIRIHILWWKTNERNYEIHTDKFIKKNSNMCQWRFVISNNGKYQFVFECGCFNSNADTTHTYIRQRRIQRTSTQCPNVTNILENVTHPTEQMTFKKECFSFVWKNATDSHSNWCAD